MSSRARTTSSSQSSTSPMTAISVGGLRFVRFAALLLRDSERASILHSVRLSAIGPRLSASRPRPDSRILAESRQPRADSRLFHCRRDDIADAREEAALGFLRLRREQDT